MCEMRPVIYVLLLDSQLISAKGNIHGPSQPTRICGQLVQNIIGTLRFAPKVLEHSLGR